MRIDTLVLAFSVLFAGWCSDVLGADGEESPRGEGPIVVMNPPHEIPPQVLGNINPNDNPLPVLQQHYDQYVPDYDARRLNLDQVLDFPHNAVVHIVCRYDDGATSSASGFIINPRTIATAAHVLYNLNQPAREVLCFVGEHPENNIEPIRPRWFVHPQDYNLAERVVARDYAFLFFDADLGHPPLPLFSYNFQDNPLPGIRFGGYPATIQCHVCRVRSIPPVDTEAHWRDDRPFHNATLNFRTTNWPGMSGSPIKVQINGAWHAIGIMVGYQLEEQAIEGIEGQVLPIVGSQACRITEVSVIDPPLTIMGRLERWQHLINSNPNAFFSKLRGLVRQNNGKIREVN